MGDKIEDLPSAQHIHDNDISSDEKGGVLDANGAHASDDTEQATAHLRQLTPEELAVEKKLRKKIDLRIMPIVVLIYLMNYIDR